MNLHCLSFFQSQKIKNMSDSCHFHGTFTYKPYLGTVCQNLLEKLSKKSVLVVDLFFCLISASFLAICQIHVGFMALSWRFVPSDFYCFSKQFHGTCMSDSWQIHRGFMPVSFSPQKSKSCQIHVTFMAVSHTSLTWVQSAKIYWRKLSKKSVLVVNLFFLPNFSFIFGNMSDSCRFHGPFMALSSF